MFKTSLFFMAMLSLVACDNTSTTDGSNVLPEASNQKNVEGNVVKPLDLSLPAEQVVADDDIDFTEKSSAPNLFDQQAKEKKYTVGGDVLRDKENLDYVDSVEGAQISVEMKIP
jgi:hypothetical protein